MKYLIGFTVGYLFNIWVRHSPTAQRILRWIWFPEYRGGKVRL